LKKIGESAWLQAALIGLLTVVAYFPALKAGFIWDDDSHLTQNPCIIGPLGLKDIWTSSQGFYYPLVLTSFWLLQKFAGLNPLPYHVLNVLMHAGSAILLWRVLRQLNVRGAWLGAALWALHPVMVQSVAWITELKNTQSCLFYLLSILFFLKAYSANKESQKWRWFFGLSLLFFAMAITSKSSTVMLPVVLGLCLWWRSGRLRWRDFALLAPFFFISAAASGWTIWEQKFHSGALGAEWTQTWPQRLAIAGWDIWFYLGKLFWPNPLIFIYPRWKIDSTQLASFLPLLAAVLGLFFLWWKRNGVLRPVFFATTYFVASLFPVLGFFNVYFFRYSFVSDHFQDLASMGPLVLAASGVVTLLRGTQPSSLSGIAAGDGGRYRNRALEKLRTWLQPALCGALLLILGVLTWRQSTTYSDVETVWRTTIARNPVCALAHLNLGVMLKEQGRNPEAEAQYREALKIQPDYAEALNTLGVCQAEDGQIEEAIANFTASLNSKPNYAPASYNLGKAFVAQGKVDDAMKSYEAALRMWSEYAEAHNSLAVLLSQSGRLDQAVGHFNEALRLKPKSAEAHNNFGVVLAEQEHFDEAIQQLREALWLDRACMPAYITLARVLVRLGRQEEAVEDLKAALRVKPDYAEAKRQLRELGVRVPE
jgi:tetratricopeptide (TPR) repeat protein